MRIESAGRFAFCLIVGVSLVGWARPADAAETCDHLHGISTAHLRYGRVYDLLAHPRHQLGLGVDVELGKNGPQVVPHSHLGDAELTRDPRDPEPCGELRGHLLLAVGQFLVVVDLWFFNCVWACVGRYFP